MLGVDASWMAVGVRLLSAVATREVQDKVPEWTQAQGRATGRGLCICDRRCAPEGPDPAAGPPLRGRMFRQLDPRARLPGIALQLVDPPRMISRRRRSIGIAMRDPQSSKFRLGARAGRPGRVCLYFVSESTQAERNAATADRSLGSKRR